MVNTMLAYLSLPGLVGVEVFGVNFTLVLVVAVLIIGLPVLLIYLLSKEQSDEQRHSSLDPSLGDGGEREGQDYSGYAPKLHHDEADQDTGGSDGGDGGDG